MRTGHGSYCGRREPRCRGRWSTPRGPGGRTGQPRSNGDIADPAQSLTAEGMDDAIAASLRERLDTLDRAEQRLSDGTYGRSVRSGLPILDERLEADPAAELTVEEAQQDSERAR